MSQKNVEQIREAIRQLPPAERDRLIEELIDAELPETAADVAALESALDQAERGELIEDADLDAYMAARRKDRRRG